MQKEIKTRIKGLEPKKRNILVLAGILMVVLLIFGIFRLTTPQHSVAAYCKVFKAEKTRLTAFPGDTYSSGVFNEGLSDAGEFVTSFAKLEKVAPDEIRPDVKTLRGIYKTMNEEPAQAIGAGLSGVGAEDNVKLWTDSNCAK